MSPLHHQGYLKTTQTLNPTTNSESSFPAKLASQHITECLAAITKSQTFCKESPQTKEYTEDMATCVAHWAPKKGPKTSNSGKESSYLLGHQTSPHPCPVSQPCGDRVWTAAVKKTPVSSVSSAHTPYNLRPIITTLKTWRIWSLRRDLTLHFNGCVGVGWSFVLLDFNGLKPETALRQFLHNLKSIITAYIMLSDFVWYKNHIGDHSYSLSLHRRPLLQFGVLIIT